MCHKLPGSRIFFTRLHVGVLWESTVGEYCGRVLWESTVGEYCGRFLVTFWYDSRLKGVYE